MGVGGGAISYVVSGLAGYLFWEKTTFCNIVHVTYHPHVVDQHIILCSVTRHRSITTIKRCWRYPVYQAFQSNSWSNSFYVVFPLQMVQDFPLILYFHGV